MRAIARCAFSAFAALAVHTLAADARANGRYPAAGQTVVAPANADHLFVRTTFGVLVSKDRGQSWDWICESAFGYASNGDPMIGVTTAETLLVATPGGLWQSPDGCTWSPAAAVGTHVVTDLVVRQDDPHAALAVTSDFTGTDGGVSFFASQVFGTGDDGATWAALGVPVAPPVLIATIEVAKSDPERIYLSGSRTSTTATEGFLIASSDLGAHWMSSAVPLVAGDLGAYLAAVDPANAGRIYVRTAGTSDGTPTGRLLVTDDAGPFRTVYSGGSLLGFALSPDGGEVFVGGLWPGDGLLASTASTLSFTQRGTLSVECLASNGAALYACSDAYASFPLGASRDDGVTFTSALDFRTIRGPLSCPSASQTAACQAQWPALVAQLGIGADAGGSAVPDASSPVRAADAAPPAGQTDAASDGSDSPSPPASSRRSGCACDARGRSAGRGFSAWALALAVVTAFAATCRAKHPR